MKQYGKNQREMNLEDCHTDKNTCRNSHKASSMKNVTKIDIYWGLYPMHISFFLNV